MSTTDLVAYLTGYRTPDMRQQDLVRERHGNDLIAMGAARRDGCSVTSADCLTERERPRSPNRLSNEWFSIITTIT